MCGIVAYLDKRRREGLAGQVLLNMLRALSCRGPDSAGVALFGPSAQWRLRLALPRGLAPDTLAGALRDLGVAPSGHSPYGVCDALLAPDADVAILEDRIRSHLPGAEVLCLGQRLSL